MWFPLALTSDITTIGKKGAGGVLPTLRRQFNDVSRSQVMQMGGEDSFSTYKVRYDSDNQVWTVVETFLSQRILTAKTTTSNPTTAAWKVGHQDDITLTVAAGHDPAAYRLLRLHQLHLSYRGRETSSGHGGV